jgi:DNA repair photolyase
MSDRMYAQRPKQGNIPVFRGCRFGCVYCEKTFKRLIMLNKKCPMCVIFEPHFHPEALLKTPPKTKDGEFITIGLSGDVSFMSADMFSQVMEYCWKWEDRKFLIQSKGPDYFRRWFRSRVIPHNVILGTTIETNLIGTFDHSEHLAYNTISKAPTTWKRFDAMLDLSDMGCKIAVTVEPILQHTEALLRWLTILDPDFLWIGYANDGHEGKKLKLPEPPLKETMQLIARLREAGIEVMGKTIRKAWWEQ